MFWPIEPTQPKMFINKFCPLTCILLTNAFLKDENIKFSSWKCKKYDKYVMSLTSFHYRW